MTNNRSVKIGKPFIHVVIAFAAGVSAVATSFAVYATSANFLVTSMNRILLDLLPGTMISYVIQTFGNLALGASMLASGVFLSVVLGTLSVVGYVGVSRTVSSMVGLPVGFVVAATAVGVPAYAVVGSLVAVVLPALVGASVTVALVELPWAEETEDVDDTRRTFVRAVGAVGAYNVAAHVAGMVRRSRTRRTERELQQTAEARRAEQLLEDARDKSLGYEDVTGLVTGIDGFYRVDINPSPPRVDADDWTLSVTGEVGEEMEFGLGDIQAEETVHRFQTLRCLGDPVDGEKMDTALWTGCPAMDVLERTEPDGEYVRMTAVDGYYYTVPIEYLEDATFAWGMNARELPQGHGYPVRVLLPDRWGKLHVKWIDEMEVVDESGTGYWEERGWEGMGRVNTVTKVDRIARPQDGVVRLLGHAYAGKRGVEDVEVSTDGGETWTSATLSGELPDDDTWRQWAYDWEAGDQSYDVLARTVDGEGNVQTRDETGPLPDGATGWASRTVSGMGR